MRPVVVAVDVAADGGAGLVEGFELFAPDAALLELGEPGLDERSASAASMTAVASCARQRMSSAQPTISRVQQSIAAFR